MNTQSEQLSRREKSIKRKVENKHSKIIRGSIISVGVLLLIYLGMSIYFVNHFHFGSVVNGINISGKTVDQADEKLAAAFKSYTLELQERGGKKEKIKADDIALKYNSKGKVKALKDNQSSFGWIFSLFSKKDSQISKIITYDKDLLKKSLDELSCLKSSNIVKPKNAQLKYTNKGYIIEKEVQGNKINKETLNNSVESAISDGKKTVNLEALDCYEKPEYTANSKKVVQAKKVFNKYIDSKITYDSGNKKVVLDKETIHKWLDVDKNFEVKINNMMIKNYIMNTLGRAYNTYGHTRDFATSVGKTVKVKGGDYGWLINTSKEIAQIMTTIKDGKTVTKKPIYKQVAVAHGNNDIGKTYVEINLTKQHLWFYKDGKLVTEGDVVTGGINKGAATPVGVYRLKYKEKNATLKGPNYSAPVSYWMPFNGGIGIHDATWRKSFGKQIYIANGSHGCINSPLALVTKMFAQITANTPVVCYTE